jgi:hypothetical protein
MAISRNHVEGCSLPDPYIIRCMEALYIGEWKFNNDIHSSVPGGIGRLYTEE